MIKGKKGASEEFPPQAIIGLIISAIFIVFIFAVIISVWFGGFTTSEQKARIALITISEKIPSDLRGNVELGTVDINLPEKYSIQAEPLCNGKTKLLLYHKDEVIDYAIVNSDAVYRGFKPARKCKKDDEGKYKEDYNKECERSGLSRIYCAELNEKGSSFGAKTSYCLYTRKARGKVYTIIFTGSCGAREVETIAFQGTLRECFEKCHLKGKECLENITQTNVES